MAPKAQSLAPSSAALQELQSQITAITEVSTADGHLALIMDLIVTAALIMALAAIEASIIASVGTAVLMTMHMTMATTEAIADILEVKLLDHLHSVDLAAADVDPVFATR